MQPLSSFPAHVARDLRGVLCDIDDLELWVPE